MSWKFNNKEFTSQDIGDYYGFIYLITHEITGRKYIGKKVFKHLKTLPPLKGKKRKRKQFKESDWKTYYGSCDELIEDLKKHGYDKCTRTILYLCKDKRDLTYIETKLQFQYDVLETLDDKGKPVYYNTNIAGKFFPRKEFVEEGFRKSNITS